MKNPWFRRRCKLNSAGTFSPRFRWKAQKRGVTVCRCAKLKYAFLLLRFCLHKHAPTSVPLPASLCHTGCHAPQALRLLNSKTSLGLLAAQWPGFELTLLGKLLRQVALQTAGFCTVQFKSKSQTMRCQVFFILLLAGWRSWCLCKVIMRAQTCYISRV